MLSFSHNLTDSGKMIPFVVLVLCCCLLLGDDVIVVFGRKSDEINVQRTPTVKR